MGVFSTMLRMSKRLPSKIRILVNNYNCAYFRSNISHCWLAVISAQKLCICDSKGLCNNINLVIAALRCRGTPFNARMNSVFGLPSPLPRSSVPLFFRRNGVLVLSDTFHSRNAGRYMSCFHIFQAHCAIRSISTRFHCGSFDGREDCVQRPLVAEEFDLDEKQLNLFRHLYKNS